MQTSSQEKGGALQVAASATIRRLLTMLHRIPPFSLFNVAVCLHGAAEIQQGTLAHWPLPLGASLKYFCTA